MDSYLSHYVPDFWSGHYNLKKWERYKRKVVVRFWQNYQPNNFNGETRKHLYLEKEQGRWKIIYEGK